MHDLGYVEGQTISYIYRSAEGRADPIARLASELVELKPNVIVTAAVLPIRALKELTSTVPIVFAAVGDAVAAGAASNLAHPGGNLTGLSFLTIELSSKRVEVLHDLLPNIRQIAVLREASTPLRWLEATREASRQLGIELQVLEVAAAPEEFDRAFEAAVTARAQALDILSSAFFNAHKETLVELAAKYRLPTMYEHNDFVRTGGLISYGPSIPDLFRRAAIYVDKILKGANPGDLPIEQPTRFELSFNLKTAKSLGLVIPESFLLRADEVIE
jgi:putative ABC transport system substrate-binding protein